MLACLVAAASPMAAQDVAYDPIANPALLMLDETALADRRVSREVLGEIDLPTGKVVATDAFVFGMPLFFALEVPPGSYEVALWRSLREPSRVAMAELRLNACRPEFFLNARLPGEITLFGDLGYGVDSGTGSFYDMDIIMGLIAAGDAAREDFQDTLLRAFEAAPDVTGFVMGETGARFAVFGSGYGDGTYGSFWALDTSGCPCALVTDFGVIENGFGYADANGPRPADHDGKRVVVQGFARFSACGLS